jgi:hypothetical protein
MSDYTFTGSYESEVEHPDGVTRLTQPGQVVTLDKNPGSPWWAPVVTKRENA